MGQLANVECESLLEHLIPLLAPLPVAAIAGDVETDLDIPARLRKPPASGASC